MTYAEKNLGFATAHKLLALEKCGFCYKKEFVDLTPNPTREEEPDYFVLGTALDVLLTEGQKAFDKKYKVVKVRSKKGKELAEENGYTLLTETMGDMIRGMEWEYMQNELFKRKRLKKKIFELEIGGVPVRAELDDYVKSRPYFIDLKTTANITKFDEHDYSFQMAFYNLIVEEATGEKKTARLEVLDKYSYFSRSRCYEYSLSTLEAERPRIIRLLELYKQSTMLGMYFPSTNPEQLECCPYYNFEGHGRLKKIIHV